MNDTWRPSDKVVPETWGAFFEYAALYDARQETMVPPDGDGRPVSFLRREEKGELHYVPLPEGCTPDRVLRFWNVGKYCKRLCIPMPKWWTITL